MTENMQRYLKKREPQSNHAQITGFPEAPANKTCDREFEAQFNIAIHAEDILRVPLAKLRPYSMHPFKAYSEEKLTALAESIRRDGLHQPIIIRAINGVAGWEILAGHNRVEAMRRLGINDISAIIRELDDDQAALVAVNTNLEQREKLLPSEKAFAYKLQMEALQNIGYQNDTRRKGEVVSQRSEDSYAQIFRYIRLTNLFDEYLDLIDQSKLPVTAGYELSFLDQEAQCDVWIYFYQDHTDEKLTVKNAAAIRAAYDAGRSITVESIPTIIHTEQKKVVKKCVLGSRMLNQYAIPDDVDLVALFCEVLEERFGKCDSITP